MSAPPLAVIGLVRLLHNADRIFLPRPGLFLTEPALYRQSYARVRLDPGTASKAMASALSMLQKQTGLWNEMTAADALALAEDGRAQAIVAARQAELATHMNSFGLMAAQTCSAVLRLRPAVNHLFPTLSRYARSIRATSPAARFKTPRLFEDVQRELVDAIGTARLDFIAGHSGSIKLVSDAPLELLPIGNLPLSLRFDVSRSGTTSLSKISASGSGRRRPRGAFFRDGNCASCSSR